MTPDYAKLLTTGQRENLHRLEQEVIHYLGARGNWWTDAWEAQRLTLIEVMHVEEKRLGVHDPRNTRTPRWPKP